MFRFQITLAAFFCDEITYAFSKCTITGESENPSIRAKTTVTSISGFNFQRVLLYLNHVTLWVHIAIILMVFYIIRANWTET